MEEKQNKQVDKKPSLKATTSGAGKAGRDGTVRPKLGLGLNRKAKPSLNTQKGTALSHTGKSTGHLSDKQLGNKNATKSRDKNKLVADNPLAGLTDSERNARLQAVEAAKAGVKKIQESQEKQLEEETKQEAQPIIDNANNEDNEGKQSQIAQDEIKQQEVIEEPSEEKSEKQLAKPFKHSNHGITSAGISKKASMEGVQGKDKKALDIGKAASPNDGNAQDNFDDATSRMIERGLQRRMDEDEENMDERNQKRNKSMGRQKGEHKRREGKLTISRALEEDDDAIERGRSLAALKRAREKERIRTRNQGRVEKIYRDVIIPDMISVAELASRMSERAGDVVKSLMKMGVMASVNQSIDGDTAEIIVTEMGHRAKRIHDTALEDEILAKDEHNLTQLELRAPVVTIMGHVDHGKTSLLDAYRQANVVAGEAGGITQHIGAYRVFLKDKTQITFLDTPGHAAFTSMRERGANVTDIIILVVAADDGIMPQTAEAIQHARAANAPVVVAINKIDKPGADPQKIITDLLNHELIPDSMGGDVQCVEISALQQINLDGLLEAVMLQAELMELKAVKNAPARGIVLEGKQVVGRGSVATLLVNSGTLKVGDIFVCGHEWGRVKAMLDEYGKKINMAEPSCPVEVLGFQGVPNAGDEFIVVPDEAKAREVAEYRSNKLKAQQNNLASQSSLEQMFAKIKGGEAKELPVVIKADVQGSVEAIIHSLEKLSNEQNEVKTRILLSGVGAISETDISLASAAGGAVFGFNVRANPQARDLAKRDNIDIRYYSIIYNLIQDVSSMLSGLLAPDLSEKIIGYADLREVFNISKVGNIAGCMVTEGEVQRGAKVRLLRDEVVIYEGALKQLKRHKNDVKEVKSGYECGIALENHEDLQVGDKLECYLMVETARSL